MEKSRKTRGVSNNNPLNIKHYCRMREGQLPNPVVGEYSKFVSLRYGWRAAFVLLFDAYACGCRTVRELVHCLFPADEGYHPDAILRKMQEVTIDDFNMLLPPPKDDCTTWSLLGEELCYGMNGTGDFGHFNEMCIGWAMAWNECFNNTNASTLRL